MAKTIADSLNKLKELQTKGRNTQQVFARLPEPETKERQKVDFNELFERHSKKICKGVYNETPAIRTLKNYFLQIEGFDTENQVLNNPNVFKGLLVFGTYGNGKTMFFEIIHSISKELVINHGWQGMWFSKVTAPWLVEEYMRATEKGYSGNFNFTSYYKGTLYIDDLGAEKLAFGRDNIITDLLFERHKNGAKTFITSNLNPNQLGKMYGARIADRLPEMVNIIKFTDKSYRE